MNRKKLKTYHRKLKKRFSSFSLPPILPLSAFFYRQKLKKEYGIKARYNHFEKYKNADYRVTICMTVYNGSKTIEKAIESVISQKVSFKFKMVIADDKSTDQTAKIIKKYQVKYPDIIFPVLREKNIGIPYAYYDVVLNHVNTEYFLILDADDWFTDPNKLQLQVVALDKHLDCGMCAHPALYIESDPLRNRSKPYKKTKVYDRFIYCHTASKMYRSSIFEFLRGKIPEVANDVGLHIMALMCQKMFFIDRVMTVYDRTAMGVSTGGRRDVYNAKQQASNAMLHRYSKGLFMDKKYFDRELLKKTDADLWEQFHREKGGSHQLFLEILNE